MASKERDWLTMNLIKSTLGGGDHPLLWREHEWPTPSPLSSKVDQRRKLALLDLPTSKYYFEELHQFF
jgi:hypothetical protein